MKALVTGGNGFIGSHLAEYLIDQGFTVYCLVRTGSNLQWLDSLDIRFVYGDCRNRESLSDAVRGMDYVFHLAGKIRASNWDTYYHANYIGTKNLIEVCEEINPDLKRFVHISSVAAAGSSTRAELKYEEDPCSPVNDYGRTKLLGEEAVRKISVKVPYVIIRPPNIYGPREKELNAIIQIVRNRIQPLFGNGEKQTTLCYVEDLVRAMLLAATSRESLGKTYYITDGKTYSYKQITDKIARALGVSNFIIPLPHCALIPIVSTMQLLLRFTKTESFLTVSRLRQIRHRYMLYSGEKAERELGFRPSISLEEGIRRSIDWYEKKRMRSHHRKGS
jgi:nucleoside-diphosphate-sugar epimerase